MAANTIFLYLDQGTTFSANVPISNTNTGNTDLDLVNYAARSMFRKHYSSSNSYTFNASIHVNDAIVMLSMNATATANVTDGRYMFDVEVYSANTGFVYRVAEGILTVTPEVTK